MLPIASNAVEVNKMKLVELAFELAEIKTEADRMEGIKKAQKSLAEKGKERCVDCGRKIDPKRRQAMPSAIRCTACQAGWEQKKCP